ncbi:MAG TPA: MFS transporter [Bryobacteraceae bacterium]|nr:MFS transporter [Bryobacteraceae bacterium]
MWPVVRVAAGNFLEAYDFQIFGYYAAAIGLTFFPSTDPYASLLASLAAFGAGFLMRPLGAIILGAYVDHRGRRAGLLLTLGLMAIGTLSIACTPGYARIGLLAPLLVLLGRLLQGLSAGVELGGVSVYLLEIAPDGRRGFFVSWQSATQQLAVVFAALLGLVLTATISPASMTRWGWRIPLLTGCLMIPFLLRLRRSLDETEAFRSRKHHPSMSGVVRILAMEWRLVLLGMMLATMVTVSFYMITAYTPTFGSAVLHLTGTASLAVTLCVGLSNFIWVPLAGALSDRIGRRPLLFGCTILTLLTAYPALSWLVSAPSFSRLLIVELWLSLMFGGYSGALVVFMTEMMPVAARTAAFSLAFTLATAIFGGFTPAACTFLIHATGNRAMPGAWLSLAAACGLFATIRLSPARLAVREAAAAV